MNIYARLAPRRLGPIEWYAVGLAGTASVVAGTSFVLGPLSDAARARWWLVAAVACIAALAERQSVRIGANTEMSVSTLPILFAAVQFGPIPAMIVGGCALSTTFGRPFTRWVIWTLSGSLLGGASGITAILLDGDSKSFGRILLTVFAAAVTLAVADIAMNALTVQIRKSGSFMATARVMGRLFTSAVPFYTPMIGVLVYAYRSFSPWTVLFFFVPALAAQRLLILYQRQAQLVSDLEGANKRLEEAGLSFAGALVAALDARDRYTAGHSAAVAVYARDIAARLGLPEPQQQLAHLCGLLHDIGKVGLPAWVLEKTGPLTLAERRQMEAHVILGERILANVDQYEEIAKVVRHHHERVDGNGYPDKLRGEEIPLLARVIAVADAYNAMTSGRPYRDAMPSAVARMRLAQAVESQFDTTVVAAFEAILAGASETYLSGARADFAVEAQRHTHLGLRVQTTLA